jgi:transposase-like protein
MARPPKYPRELLDRGARVVIESGRPIAHVACDLGVPPETLRRHVRRIGCRRLNWPHCGRLNWPHLRPS